MTETDPRDWGGFGSDPAELVRLTDLHLSPDLRWYLGDTSHPAYSRILLALGAVVLVIACVNFAELSVGTASTRAREIAVRKVLGGSRAQLARQLLGEAAFASGAGLALAIALAEALLPQFCVLVEQDLAIDYRGDWPLLAGVAVVASRVRRGQRISAPPAPWSDPGR